MLNSSEQTKQAEPAEALEALIDVHGLARIVELLGDVCYEKADHLASNWQDENTAKEWTRRGKKIHAILNTTGFLN